MTSLVTELQAQAEAALPHHHFNCSYIFEGNNLPLGSVLVFQDHGHDAAYSKVGESQARISGRSRMGGIADVWIVAWCEGEQLEVEMSFSARIEAEKTQWLSSSLKELLA